MNCRAFTVWSVIAGSRCRGRSAGRRFIGADVYLGGSVIIAVNLARESRAALIGRQLGKVRVATVRRIGHTIVAAIDRHTA